MMYQVLGFRRVDFKNEEGKEFKGYSVYLCTEFRNGEGCMPVLNARNKPFFFSDAVCKKFGWKPAVNQQLDISTTLGGMFDNIRVL